MKLLATSFVLAALDTVDDTAFGQWTDCAVVSAAVALKNPQSALATFLNTMSTVGWTVSSTSSTTTKLASVPGMLKAGDGPSLGALLRLLATPSTPDIRALLDWWWTKASAAAVAIAGVNQDGDGNLVAELRGFYMPSFGFSVVTEPPSLDVTVTRSIFSFNAQVYSQVAQSLSTKAAGLASEIRTADTSFAAAGV